MGQPATHVGSSNTTVYGTEGDDVIISGSAHTVYGLGGNDLICPQWNEPTIYAGPGDDIIHQGGHHDGWSEVHLGPGSDTYLSESYIASHVHTGAGDASDVDSVTTHGSDPYPASLIIASDYHGTLTGDIGWGPFDLTVLSTTANWHVTAVDESSAPALISASCDACEHIEVDLGRGTYAADGTALGTFSGFRDVSVSSVPSAKVVGNKKANEIWLRTCFGEAHGWAGSDVIGSGALFSGFSCDKRKMRFYGNRGHDELSGAKGNDKLYGGKGYDRATGRKGRDLCRAEVKKGCER